MKILILLCLGSAPIWATISANSLARVFPTTGSSTNGGGFDPSVASPGTDYSVNVNKNASGCTSCGSSTVDLSTTDAVAVGTTTITSVAGNFSTALPGNIIYFTGGTGSITAVRRTVTARASTTSITIDASIAASTGMTMNIGGAVDTIATAFTFNTGGMAVCVKSTGTITITATQNLNNNQGGGAFNRLFGYTTTCGDHGPVSYTFSTNTGITGFLGDGQAAGWWIDGFNIDCASLGTSTGIAFGGQSILTHSKIANCTTRLYKAGGTYTNTQNVEFTGCTSACTDAILPGNNATFKFIYAHDNVTNVMSSSSQVVITDSIFSNTTGTTKDVIKFDLYYVIERNVFYSATGNCLIDDGSGGHIYLGTSIQNNIFVNCGIYAINGSASSIQAVPTVDGNAFFGSGTANRRNIDNTTTAAPYTNIWDIQLTADPFVNAAAGNFALNATSGGGTALKGTGQAGYVGPAWSKATGTGYMDLGVFQTQYGTGSAGGGNQGNVQ